MTHDTGLRRGLQEDRFFAPDIEAASQLLASGCLNALLPARLLPSL